MATRGRRRDGRNARFVPKLIFGTLCATTVVPACSSGTSTSRKDGGAGTGNIQGVAAGGFGGATVAAGGFGGAGVGAGGFGGAGVAAGGFAGFSVFAAGFGGAVAAGGFGGVDSGLGGFAGFQGVANSGFGGLPDSSAMNESPNSGNWAVTGAFTDPETSPFVAQRRSRKARRTKRRRR